MKDISVILNDFGETTAIKQTLDSLQFINERVEGVTALVSMNDAFVEPQIPTLKCQIKYIKKNINIEEQIASLIQSISSKYILFFNEGEFLRSTIQSVNLELKNEQKVMTCFYKFKKNKIQQPFLFKASYLKSIDFFHRYKLPFKEALLPALLMTVGSSEIVRVNSEIIKRKFEGSASTFQKWKLIEKYTSSTLFERDEPSISVVLANFNMAKYIDIALSSCLLQTNLPNQILVMDDGSTDGSYKKLKEWGKLPLVQVFQKENEGKARALNDLLPYVTSEFILELDADDWLDPDAVAVIRQNLKSLSKDSTVLYGNLRSWKQRSADNLTFKVIRKGSPIRNKNELISYRFPLGPRIYRFSALRKNRGFPIISFKNGRMFEDVSVLNDLMKKGRLMYRDFTVYNVREHKFSITKRNRPDWNDFLKYLN